MRRNFDVQASDPTAAGGVDYWAAACANGSRGWFDGDTVVGTNDQFSTEVKPESGAVLTIQRTAPPRLDTSMDLK